MSTPHHVDTLVVGAGHAGLAVSRLLTAAGRDHVVLDRGRIGERWRSERWDSLHLLTPNWMTRLPGWQYSGADRDGFLSSAGLVRSLERYAASFDAPVVGGTTVESVTSIMNGRYEVRADRGTWRARHVVVASGPNAEPNRPAGLAPCDVEVLTARDYRNPAQVAPGGVLVVGGSSSGVQIADELNRAGRDVVLAVGRHTRLPRRYRGMDVFWWMERTGRLARTIDEVADPESARHEPSLQLVGRNDLEHRDQGLDLLALHLRGVRLAGRLRGLRGRWATFSDDLGGLVAAADRTMHRFLDAVDRHIDDSGLTREVLPPLRPARFTVPPTPRRLDLRREGIGTVLLATGFHPDHSWLRLPIFGDDGAIEQRRGVTAVPGVYVVGQKFQHRRDSSFIDGARHDAHAVVAHLTDPAGGAVPAQRRRDQVLDPAREGASEGAGEEPAA